MKLVEVSWVDSQRRSGWFSLESYEDDGVNVRLDCKSVGYLIIDEENRIGLIQSLSWFYGDEPRDGDGLMIIPRVAVTKIRKLK